MQDSFMNSGYFGTLCMWPAIFFSKSTGISPELEGDVRWAYSMGQFLAISVFLLGPQAC